MNDLRFSCVKASKKLIVLVVNMEITSPICLRPKALVRPRRLLKHRLISTAVPRSPSPCAEVCFKQLQKNKNTSDCGWKLHRDAFRGQLASTSVRDAHISIEARMPERSFDKDKLSSKASAKINIKASCQTPTVMKGSG